MNPSEIALIANVIAKRVAELPDRTSPDDWPDAMLVTAEELFFIVTDELSDQAAGNCPRCDGRGYVSGDPEGAPIEDCDKCGGKGQIQALSQNGEG